MISSSVFLFILDKTKKKTVSLHEITPQAEIYFHCIGIKIKKIKKIRRNNLKAFKHTNNNIITIW